PDQSDINRDGLGTACDAVEQQLFSEPRGLDGLLRFEELSRVARLPIPGGADCPPWLPESFETRLEVATTPDLEARIVDDQGFTVEGPIAGSDLAISFRPRADAPYVPADAALDGFGGGGGGAAGSDRVYQGRRYFLELAPTPGVQPGKDLR